MVRSSRAPAFGALLVEDVGVAFRFTLRVSHLAPLIDVAPDAADELQQLIGVVGQLRLQQLATARDNHAAHSAAHQLRDHLRGHDQGVLLALHCQVLVLEVEQVGPAGRGDYLGRTLRDLRRDWFGGRGAGRLGRRIRFLGATEPVGVADIDPRAVDHQFQVVGAQFRNHGIAAFLLGEQTDVELDQAALGAFHQAGIQRAISGVGLPVRFGPPFIVGVREYKSMDARQGATVVGTCGESAAYPPSNTCSGVGNHSSPSASTRTWNSATRRRSGAKTGSRSRCPAGFVLFSCATRSLSGIRNTNQNRGGDPRGFRCVLRGWPRPFCGRLESLSS